ncbi:MAG: bifunctional 5,10-methylenetetrahydrofolate dehydrogenase/5,10-methenyltetrahydrofolate cyclohydrolase [Candidatus Pacebacteria bacterium]|nr:bifunctional 5,10-methylenetetrahydrofolate dehydrogenase/5,10-methenyltetrahydrofolate cyclohydrolase [Candidatus Paceibacterota bacterium]
MVIDGKKLSQEIIEELKKEREKLPYKIRLAVILVGEDEASLSFIRQKEKVAKEIGIEFKLYQYDENLKTKDLRKNVNNICRLGFNKGVVIQLPLPPQINTQSVLNAIPPEKDIDVLSEKNLGRFYTGRLKILPPAVGAIKFLLKKYNIEIPGKNVLIIGRGLLVGKPSALWFINERATVTVANSKTQNLPELTKKADIIVTAAGVPNLIPGDLVKEGAVIFDAAVVSEKGRLAGDCDLKSLENKVKLITPVPAGLGPLTVAFLYKNLLYKGVSSFS